MCGYCRLEHSLSPIPDFDLPVASAGESLDRGCMPGRGAPAPVAPPSRHRKPMPDRRIQTALRIRAKPARPDFRARIRQTAENGGAACRDEASGTLPPRQKADHRPRGCRCSGMAQVARQRLPVPHERNPAGSHAERHLNQTPCTVQPFRAVCGYPQTGELCGPAPVGAAG